MIQMSGGEPVIRKDGRHLVFICPDGRSCPWYKESNCAAKDLPNQYISRVISPFAQILFISASNPERENNGCRMTPRTMTQPVNPGCGSQPFAEGTWFLFFHPASRLPDNIRERYAGPDQWGRVSLKSGSPKQDQDQAAD